MKTYKYEYEYEYEYECEYEYEYAPLGDKNWVSYCVYWLHPRNQKTVANSTHELGRADRSLNYMCLLYTGPVDKSLITCVCCILDRWISHLLPVSAVYWTGG